VSTKNRKTLQKIVALVKTNSDIILLSDTRLNFLIQKAAANDIKKKLEFAGYEFLFNSPFASRGVSILIKKSLGFTVSSTHADRTGNILAVEFKTTPELNNDEILTVVAVYGPNDNNLEFYSDLDSILDQVSREFMLIGGDWNSTWDSSPPDTNIDILNMRNLPSPVRTARLSRIAQKFNLAEPFRYLFPNKCDYTYIPNAVANNNRSRLDYFLISHNTLEITTDAGIYTEKLSQLFDHKSATLELGKPVLKPDRNKLSDQILSNPIVELVVELSVKECYLNNVDFNAVPRYTVNTLKSEIGRIYNKLSSASTLELNAIKTNTINENVRTQIYIFINLGLAIAETLLVLEYFENLPLSVSPDIFFEGLVLSVKNEVLSKQSLIFKIKNFRKRMLQDVLWNFKKNYPQNFEEISRIETNLNNIVEDDLKQEFSN
jgi:exonuclease III